MMIFEPNLNCAGDASSPLTHISLQRGVSATPMLIKTEEHYKHLHDEVILDPRGGSLSLTHVVVLHLLLVDFFVSQPTVFIETS